MTLVIGLKAKDGVVLASDSRASSTISSNDTVQKIFKLDDHSAVGIAGDGGLANYFLDQIKGELNYGKGISSLAEEIRVKGKEKFNDFFEHLDPEKRPSLSLIVVGYTQTGEAEIYSLNSLDNFVPRKSVTGFETIGVPYIADYLLNRLYEAEIKIEAGKELAVLCIEETSSQDRSVGGPIRVASFSDTKKLVETPRPDVDALRSKAQQFQFAQKGKFYPEELD